MKIYEFEIRLIIMVIPIMVIAAVLAFNYLQGNLSKQGRQRNRLKKEIEKARKEREDREEIAALQRELDDLRK